MCTSRYALRSGIRVRWGEVRWGERYIHKYIDRYLKVERVDMLLDCRGADLIYRIMRRVYHSCDLWFVIYASGKSGFASILGKRLRWLVYCWWKYARWFIFVFVFIFTDRYQLVRWDIDIDIGISFFIHSFVFFDSNLHYLLLLSVPEVLMLTLTLVYPSPNPNYPLPSQKCFLHVRTDTQSRYFLAFSRWIRALFWSNWIGKHVNK